MDMVHQGHQMLRTMTGAHLGHELRELVHLEVAVVVLVEDAEPSPTRSAPRHRVGRATGGSQEVPGERVVAAHGRGHGVGRVLWGRTG